MRRILIVSLAASICLSGCAAAAARAALRAGGGGGGRADPAELLLRADANGDGIITRAEFTAAEDRLFSRLDRDGDGYLTAADRGGRLARRRQGSGGASTAGMDADGDGRVSRDEFHQRLDRMFERADRNGDGVIDATERAALARAGS